MRSLYAVCIFYEKTYNDKMEMIETECPWIELSATSHQIRHIEFPLFYTLSLNLILEK